MKFGIRALFYENDNKPEEEKVQTEVSTCLVIICMQNLEINLRRVGLDVCSQHYCWSNFTRNDKTELADLFSSQIRQHLISFVKDNVHTLKDPSPSDYIRIAEQISQASVNNRCLVLFNGHGLAKPFNEKEIVLFPNNDDGIDSITVSDFFSKFTIPTCFIFDADMAGVLYNRISTSSTGNKDRFAFFSCASDEMLPRRIGLPTDLFTSCLLTPAFIALLWGSRQFYAFSSGGLHEFNLSFFGNENGIRPHFITFSYEITRLLDCLVKSMAYNALDNVTLFELFFRDPKVGKLYVNFCLARRIANEVGFTPISYPSIPDLSRHPLWEYFDMYIDRVLFLLTQMESSKSVNQLDISNDLHSFLEDALTSIVNSLAQYYFEAIPNEIALFPIILDDPQLQDDCLDALIKFLDSGEKALQACLCIGILSHLSVLPFQKKMQLLLPSSYAACKLLCYAHKYGSPYTLYRVNITSMVKFLLQIQNKISVIMALVLETTSIVLDPGNESDSLDPQVLSHLIGMLNSDDELIQYWVLLFVNVLFSNDYLIFDDSAAIFQSCLHLYNSSSAEVRAAFISVLSSFFILHPSVSYHSLILTVIETSLDEPSHIERMQLLLFMRNILHQIIKKEDKDSLKMINNITSKLSILVEDPHPQISQISKSVLKEINNKNCSNKNHIVPALLFGSFDSFLSCNYTNLSEHSIPPFSLPQKPIQKLVSLPFSNKQLRESRFTEIDHYNPDRMLSSNIVFLDGEKIVFGDEKSNLLVRNYGDHGNTLVHSGDLFFNSTKLRFPLSTIIPLSEDSFILSQKNGRTAIVSNILGSTPLLVDSFNVASLEKPLIPLLEYNPYSRVLYSGNDDGVISSWNIESCCHSPDVYHVNGKIKSIKSMFGSESVLSIVSNELSFIDFRLPDQASVVISKNKLYSDIAQFHYGNINTTLIDINGSVCLFDIRSPDQEINITRSSESQYIDTCRWCQCVLSYGSSLILVDTVSKNSFNVIDQLFARRKRPEFIQSCSLHKSKPSFGFVTNNNSLHIVGVVTE